MRAMWKIRKLDEQLFDGAAANIYEYLDIEPLMPPGRLRLSKSLKRPMMHPLRCDCMGRVFLQECRDMDCMISGTYRKGCKRWRGHASEAPVDIDNIYIVSDEDRAFGKAWYDKHGVTWPRIQPSGTHPALTDLVRRDSSKEWGEDYGINYARRFWMKTKVCVSCNTVKIAEDVQSRPQ